MNLADFFTRGVFHPAFDRFQELKKLAVVLTPCFFVSGKCNHE